MILKQDESGKGYLKDKVFEKKEALLRFTNLLSICNQEKKVSKDQMSSTKTKTKSIALQNQLLICFTGQYSKTIDTR